MDADVVSFAKLGHPKVVNFKIAMLLLNLFELPFAVV